MPWYRIKGHIVYLKFGSSSMERIDAPPCQERHESGQICAGLTEYQCDWKVGDGHTCDKFICPAHALEVASGKHLCPEHQIAYSAWLERRRR